MIESQFEKQLVDKLKKMYPGAYVIKNNPNYIQGFPDRVFLYKNFWAAFDAKRDANAPIRPNQAYYIEKLDKMSFAMFVHPGNEEEFLYGLQRSLTTKGNTRIP